MIIEPLHLEKRPRRYIGSLPPDVLNLENDPFVRAVGPVEYNLLAELAGDELLVRGSLKARLKCLCARCGVWFEKDQLVSDFIRSIALTPNKLAIDLTFDLREDMLLGFPSNWFCREDCRGLCSICGADLNQAKCACDNQGHTAGAGVWDVLDQAKLK